MYTKPPKNIFAKFTKMENFKPPRNPSIIPVTRNPEYPSWDNVWQRVAEFTVIGLVTVFDTILTSRQTR